MHIARWGSEVLPTDPSTLVEFHNINNQVQAKFSRPLTITSPPMLTSFPRTTEADITREKEKGMRITAYETDICMKGSGPAQEQFRAFLDSLDTSLLAHVALTPGIVASQVLSQEQLAVMLKRQFRSRSNYKTGKVYPDAMTCRSKITPDTADRLPVFDVNNFAHKEPLKYNDIIRVNLTYNGPYAIRGSFFGNSWQLTSVQFCGHAETEETTQFEPPDPADFPKLG